MSQEEKKVLLTEKVESRRDGGSDYVLIPTHIKALLRDIRFWQWEVCIASGSMNVSLTIDKTKGKTVEVKQNE